MDKKQSSDVTNANDEQLRYVMPSKLSLSNRSKCAAPPPPPTPLFPLLLVAGSWLMCSMPCGASGSFFSTSILPRDSQFFKSESLTASTSGVAATLGTSSASATEKASSATHESEAEDGEEVLVRAVAAKRLRTEAGELRKNNADIKVQLSELSAACGFCGLGRPIDLWNNKMLSATRTENVARDDDAQTAHSKSAAEMCARLYTFLTGNVCEVPNGEWPATLDVGVGAASSCVRCVERDVHDAERADGFLWIYSPLVWGEDTKGPFHSLHEPRPQDLLVAHLLLSMSAEPRRSWVDMLCCSFQRNATRAHNEFALSKPMAKNAGLTRVYYTGDTIARPLALRLAAFCALRNADDAPAWMNARANVDELNAKLVEATHMEKPHSFLCNGEYGNDEQWRRCATIALTRALRRKDGRSQAGNVMQAPPPPPLTAEVLVPARDRSLGAPYLHLAKTIKL